MNSQILNKVIILLGIFYLSVFVTCSKDPASPVSSAPLSNYTYQIIEEFPHRQDAFTQGLYYYNGFLYESTGLYGNSSLRKVDLTTGTVLDSLALQNQYFAEGMTIFQNRIYQLTWQSNIGFVYQVADFSVLDSFTYSTEGWGLTHNETHLIMSDGSDTIRFMDPTNFQEVKKIGVTWEGESVNRINELEYINNNIYANIWYTDQIAIISPESGNIISWINLADILGFNDCPQPINVLNGIAYDSQAKRLLVTGKLWCKLFHIKLIAE
jgi:glutamine cyclotransferase